MRRVALVVALIGCSRGGAARVDDGAAAIPVAAMLDDHGIDAIPIGDAAVDLWTLCDTYDLASIDVHGAGGAFVHGECAHRDQYTLRAQRRGGRLIAELRRHDDVVASADVTTIELESAAAAAAIAQPAPALRVVVDGAAIDVSADALHDDQPGGQRMQGGSLGAVLAIAGVEPDTLAAVTIHAPEGDYAIDPAWLRSTHDDLRVRYNQRGLVRFGHLRDGVEVARRTGVTSIEVRR